MCVRTSYTYKGKVKDPRYMQNKKDSRISLPITVLPAPLRLLLRTPCTKIEEIIAQYRITAHGHVTFRGIVGVKELNSKLTTDQGHFVVLQYVCYFQCKNRFCSTDKKLGPKEGLKIRGRAVMWWA